MQNFICFKIKIHELLHDFLLLLLSTRCLLIWTDIIALPLNTGIHCPKQNNVANIVASQIHEHVIRNRLVVISLLGSDMPDSKKKKHQLKKIFIL